MSTTSSASKISVSSSDFGLYKERQLKNNLCPIKFICIVSAFLVLSLIVYVIVTSTRIQKANPSEKLIGMNSMKHEEYLKVPGSNPKPFGFNFQGPKPHQFTTSTTESVMNYPQLMQYRNQNRYFPKSIQEIIGYVSLNKQSKNAKEKHFGASNLEGIRGNFTSPSTSNGFSAQDPFHYYKPSDPSDVNLLATASFRFAPPIWKTGQNPKSPQILQAQTQTVEDTSAPEPTGYRLPRPIVLTLNIWPMDEVYKAQDLPVVNQPRYGQRYIPISNKNNNYLNYNKGQELRQKLFGTGAMNLNNKKMTINLNFFPDPVNGHGEIQNEESSNFVKKKFFNRY